MTVTKTIGTSSRDYSTITLWEADLDDSGIYSSGDDAVGVCYNDSVFDESVTINGGGTIGLASRLLTVAEADRHDGTAGTGARMVASVNARQILIDITTTTVEWLEIDLNGYRTHNSGSVYINTVVGNDGYVGNMIVHGAYGTQYSARGIGARNDSHGNIQNCIVYDLEVGVSTDNFVAQGIFSNARTGRGVNNCTVHNIVNNTGAARTGQCIGLASNGTANLCRNNIITDTSGTTSGTIQDLSASSPSYNATSDTSSTGTGALTSIVTADQYVSTIIGSEDLHLKANSDCIRAGTDLAATPIGVNIDINGYDRDAGGKGWSIGAHEWVRTTTVTIGTSGRDYSTFALWDADMDAHANGLSIGDDVVAEIYDDSAFNETLSYDGNTNLYDSLIFRAAAGERHDGTAGTGVRNIVASGSGTTMLFYRQPNLLVEGLEIGCSAITDRRESLLSVSGIAVNHSNARVSKILAHDAYQFASGGAIIMGGYFATNYVVENCIVYNWGIRTTSTTQHDRGGITTSQYARTGCQILNCTVYNVQSYDNPATQIANCFNTQASWLVKNCIGVQAEDDCFNSTATQTTNMSSDTTASGVTSVTVADQFVSTVGGSEDLHLKAGSDAIDAGTDLGTTPTGVNIDINGRDRDAEGDVWDIGAHEFVAVASNLIKRVGPVTWASIKRLGPVVLANLKKVFNQDT